MNISLDISEHFIFIANDFQEISEHYFFKQLSEIGGQLVKWVDFMEYSRYFQEIYPSQGTQAMLTQETKKV